MPKSLDRSRTRALALAAVAVVLTFGAACGDDDDGARVRDLDATGSASGSATGSATGSGTGSATGSATGSGTGSATGTAAGDVSCRPVGTELEGRADSTVDITLRDYAFDPSTVEVPAGVVTFTADNQGDEPHELAFLPGGGEVPFEADGDPDEDAIEAAGAFELEAFGPGQTCNATYELEPGTYTLFCLVEAADGEAHAAKGMVGRLTVS